MKDGTSMSLLFAAVGRQREQVIRTLVRLGADIDQLHNSSDDGQVATPIGQAIAHGKLPMLRVCHQVGANMSKVFIQNKNSSFCSAVELAIWAMQPACLIYLLDEVNPARPLDLSERALVELCVLAKRGRSAIAIFRILASQEYDFKALKRFSFDIPGSRGARETMQPSAPIPGSFYDFLLTNARNSGDTHIVRYVVKSLGVGSNVQKMEGMHGFIDEIERDSGRVENSEALPRAALTKYLCVSCEE